MEFSRFAKKSERIFLLSGHPAVMIPNWGFAVKNERLLIEGQYDLSTEDFESLGDFPILEDRQFVGKDGRRVSARVVSTLPPPLPEKGDFVGEVVLSAGDIKTLAACLNVIFDPGFHQSLAYSSRRFFFSVFGFQGKVCIVSPSIICLLTLSVDIPDSFFVSSELVIQLAKGIKPKENAVFQMASEGRTRVDFGRDFFFLSQDSPIEGKFREKVSAFFNIDAWASSALPVRAIGRIFDLWREEIWTKRVLLGGKQGTDLKAVVSDINSEGIHVWFNHYLEQSILWSISAATLLDVYSLVRIVAGEENTEMTLSVDGPKVLTGWKKSVHSAAICRCGTMDLCVAAYSSGVEEVLGRKAFKGMVNYFEEKDGGAK